MGTGVNSGRDERQQVFSTSQCPATRAVQTLPAKPPAPRGAPPSRPDSGAVLATPRGRAARCSPGSGRPPGPSALSSYAAPISHGAPPAPPAGLGRVPGSAEDGPRRPGAAAVPPRGLLGPGTAQPRRGRA